MAMNSETKGAKKCQNLMLGENFLYFLLIRYILLNCKKKITKKLIFRF